MVFSIVLYNPSSRRNEESYIDIEKFASDKCVSNRYFLVSLRRIKYCGVQKLCIVIHVIS